MVSNNCVTSALVLVVCIGALCEGGKAGLGRKKVNGGKNYSGKCKPHISAEYELAFQAGWTESVYPKMYPKIRPSAEWSKLLGRQHIF